MKHVAGMISCLFVISIVIFFILGVGILNNMKNHEIIIKNQETIIKYFDSIYPVSEVTDGIYFDKEYTKKRITIDLPPHKTKKKKYSNKGIAKWMKLLIFI